MSERRRQGDDLTGRRGGYEELKGELHHFFRRIWIFMAIIGLTSAVALGGFAYLLREQDKRVTELCESRNVRHDNAINELIAGSNQDQMNAKDSISREEIRRRRDVTIGLINAITPKTDCEDPQVAKRLPEVTPIPEEGP